MVNLIKYPHKTTITKPFALHFSSPNKKKERIYKKRFGYYYVKNSNVSQIPDWNLLCIDYKFKIARFYDKNFLTILKQKILNFLKDLAIFKCNNCKKYYKFLKYCSLESKCDFKPIGKKRLIRFIISRFSKNYSKSLIINAIHKLVEEGKLTSQPYNYL